MYSLGRLGRDGLDGLDKGGFAGSGLDPGDGGLVGRIERTSDGYEVLDPMGLELFVGTLKRVRRNAFDESVFPGTCPGPGLRGEVSSLDGGLAGLTELTSNGVDVLACTGLRGRVFAGSLGRVGRSVLGENVIPGTGLGPGLRGVVSLLDGGLAGLTELTSVGDDVIACIG